MANVARVSCPWVVREERAVEAAAVEEPGVDAVDDEARHALVVLRELHHDLARAQVPDADAAVLGAWAGKG